MKGRAQKISRDTWRQNNRTASEGYAAGQTFMGITENNLTNIPLADEYLLEQILSPKHLNTAYKRVLKNRGAAGVDGMEVSDLKEHLIAHKEALITRIQKGKYRPLPVRRVEISKPGGGVRELGVPTVVDRVLQQSIVQVLSPLCEPKFSDHSYGFRPRRSAHMAIKKVQGLLNEGYTYAVDIDLEKFFDTVHHQKLIQVLQEYTRDGRVLSLIHRYLRSGVVTEQGYKPSERGMPQGGPLSPLLSNILLNELDRELERRGHKFVRYADDLLLLCKSKRASERIAASVIEFIERRLLLKVNRTKTRTGHIRGTKFLGYAFYARRANDYRPNMHPKSLSRMKNHLRWLTSRSNGWGYERRKQALTQYIQGWMQYFKLAMMKKKIMGLDEWYRRRLRMCIWKQWKKVRTRATNLKKLGLSKWKAWQYANTRKGYWKVAGSPILKTAITVDKLRRADYPLLLDIYKKVYVN